MKYCFRNCDELLLSSSTYSTNENIVSNFTICPSLFISLFSTLSCHSLYTVQALENCLNDEYLRRTYLFFYQRCHHYNLVVILSDDDRHSSSPYLKYTFRPLCLVHFSHKQIKREWVKCRLTYNVIECSMSFEHF